MITSPDEVRSLLNLNYSQIASLIETIDRSLTSLQFVHAHAVGYVGSSDPRKPTGVAVPCTISKMEPELQYIINRYLKVGWGEVALEPVGEHPQALVFLFEKRPSTFKEMLSKWLEPVTTRHTAWMMTWTETENGAGRPDGYSLHSELEHAIQTRHGTCEITGTVNSPAAAPRSHSQPDMDPVQVFISVATHEDLISRNGFMRGSGRPKFEHVDSTAP